MGYGTEFIYEEYISRRLFNSKAELEDYIEELEEDLKFYENRFLTYAVSNPINLVDKDDSRSDTDAISSIMTELIEDYRELLNNLTTGYKYLEVYDEVNKK